MTDTSSVDNDLVSLAPTAASILGIKTPLRFRPHGSSQKAHVVLRRVDPESDSEGEGEAKGAVQFSLFAYKRIEVKPGKEILLTVADGPFKDRAIIFEGDELGASSLSDVEEETQVAEDDDAFVPPEQSLPLKMRKPWTRRLEASVLLAHVPPPGATRHSIGVQTDPLIPSPVPEENPQTVCSIHARNGLTFPSSKPFGVSVSPILSNDVKVALPSVDKSTEVKTGVARPQHAERNHSLSPVKVDPATDSSIPPFPKRHPNSSSPSKQNDVSTSASTDVHVNDQVERWSPSVPVPIALPVTTRLSDETSESANSVSVTEDGNPPVLVPERPWSPSVPAALSTQPSRRHNIKGQRAELLEDANSSSETQPSLRTKLPPSSTSSSPVPPTPPSPTKIRLPAKPRSSSFVPGSFVSDITNQPPFAFSDEDTKTNILPGKTSSSPPLQPSSGPLLPAEAPSSPPVAYPPSPNLRKDHLPSRLSPASSRGSFSHGPLESSATSVPSHPSSPKQSLKKPQTLSWPPFRPGRDDGSTDFYPPFRAGPETGEPLPPQNFRPTSGPATPHDHIPLNPQIRGRPAMISNPIPVAPRYSSVTLPSGPGRPSSPASQLSHNSQLFGPSMSPKPPLKLSHGIVPDIGQPPRQPRAEVAPPAMGSPPMSQGMTPRNFPHFHRYQRLPNAPRPLVDGRGRGIPIAAGAKRKASPPRMEPPMSLEIPPKRPPPSTWPTASPIRCATVQGESVAIQGIAFNRTGNLMAVTCADCSIRVWDNVTYSEVARLPHSSSVVSAQWMDDDAGVLALCMDGALVRWTRPAGNTPPRAHDIWNWVRLADPIGGATPEDAPTALAYKGDKIAASFPKLGVYVWMMKQGSWQSQRPIDRQNVTAIEFVNDGKALLGGTKDGVLWYCPVSETVPRLYNVFKARICGIDVLPTETHALVSQQVGRAHLVAISQDEHRGKVMQVYTVEHDLQAEAVYDANALFVGHNDAVLYGSARGYLFAWDKTSAKVLCGLDHGEGSVVQTIGVYRRSDGTGESCVVTGSREGKLSWWEEPMGTGSIEEFPSGTGKRLKSS